MVTYTHSQSEHIGAGIYNLTTLAYRSGYYDYYLLVQDVDAVYRQIAGSPFRIYVNPSNASNTTTSVRGSGVTKAIIGRKEQIYLQVNDIYGNPYN